MISVFAVALIALAGPTLAQDQIDFNAKCSAEADVRGLHGQERRKFRDQCRLQLNQAAPKKVVRTVVRLPEFGPSFDCLIAKIAVTRLICGDKDLITADTVYGKAFQDAERAAPPEHRKTLAIQEMKWLRERNQKCGLAGKDRAPIEELRLAKQCMEDVINDRISDLENRRQSISASQAK